MTPGAPKRLRCLTHSTATEHLISYRVASNSNSSFPIGPSGLHTGLQPTPPSPSLVFWCVFNTRMHLPSPLASPHPRSSNHAAVAATTATGNTDAATPAGPAPGDDDTTTASNTSPEATTLLTSSATGTHQTTERDYLLKAATTSMTWKRNYCAATLCPGSFATVGSTRSPLTATTIASSGCNTHQHVLDSFMHVRRSAPRTTLALQQHRRFVRPRHVGHRDPGLVPREVF
ncbi:hypothetical protein C8F04DRAFT_274476 [Mycena alexandri]|uniref:Uncharacterized protein n=1 Tax=Mycena alexandri TaxID=1745969 RepID=A0AAD6S5U8_9AGAR|nr:hypothetical protein C8F04DRAFT_274476 [Mycena alexandri]